MKKHLIQLIRILKQSEAPITSSSLSNALNVSPRSVKSYITEINDTLPDTVTSSRKGYVIDKEKAEELLNESKSLIPQTKDERVSYIINRLIKQGVLNAYDLCDEMFVSYSTLKNDLVAVRHVLSETSLELINQNDTLVINGLEKNKRKLLSVGHRCALQGRTFDLRRPTAAEIRGQNQLDYRTLSEHGVFLLLH